MAVTPAQPQQIPPIVYGSFTGNIDQAALQKIFNSFAIAMNMKVREVHLFFHSTGGGVADGIALYNYFKALTLELTLYNGATVHSAALVGYLGAPKRKTSTHATFMLHRVTSPPQAATAGRLEDMAQSVALDDQRISAILRQHIKMPDDKWARLDRFSELHISPQESITYGIADEIKEFAPPAGTPIFNI